MHMLKGYPVHRKTLAECLNIFNKVLIRLEKADMILRKNKCAFMTSDVEYLDHEIAKDGLQLLESKVEAVTKAPCLHNITDYRLVLATEN